MASFFQKSVSLTPCEVFAMSVVSGALGACGMCAVFACFLR
jgi:hypothetical protein